jgi:3'-phosphoadenosine 5'-phosphosulfate sulfotransferase (PAPS reductase)/FAD synthetase
MRRYIVSVSGGAGSTVALERCIEQFGYDRVVAVFADTNTEHESLYDLLRAIQERHPKLEFVWLSDGRNIWDVFDQHGIIKTPTGACKASLELKQKPIAKWVKENCDPSNDILVSGLEWSEPERRERFDKRWEPYTCWHPLADAPILSNCQVKDALDEYGYPEQPLYQRRYPHNNCGGGYVLAGHGQWAGLYQDDLPTYRWHQERERLFNENHRAGKKKWSILRDQGAETIIEGGEVVIQKKNTPIMLDEFEVLLQTNKINLRDFRSACGCYLGEQTNMFDLLDEPKIDCN